GLGVALGGGLLPRTEGVRDLVVLVGLYRLDGRNHGGSELAEAGDQNPTPSLPVAPDPPEVLGDDPHQSEVSAAMTSRSRLDVTSTAATTPRKAATPAITNATS